LPPVECAVTCKVHGQAQVKAAVTAKVQSLPLVKSTVTIEVHGSAPVEAAVTADAEVCQRTGWNKYVSGSRRCWQTDVFFQVST